MARFNFPELLVEGTQPHRPDPRHHGVCFHLHLERMKGVKLPGSCHCTRGSMTDSCFHLQGGVIFHGVRSGRMWSQVMLKKCIDWVQGRDTEDQNG